MRRNLLILVELASLLSVGWPVRAQSAAPAFDGARWIWFSRELMPITTAQSFPGGVHYFRAAARLPDPKRIIAAEVIITADNLWSLHLNGRLVGESVMDNSSWGNPQRFDVRHLLVEGRNVVAVEAVNTVPGPAGLILKLAVQSSGGPEVTLVSDDAWLSTDQETPVREQPSFDDRCWRAVHVAGDLVAAPWGRVSVRAAAWRGGAARPNRARHIDGRARHRPAQARLSR